MKSKIVFHNNGTCTYSIDGKEVTKAEYKKAHKIAFTPGQVASCAGNTSTCWPMYSEAMAVHPEQVPEVIERNKKHGVHVEYDKMGRAKLMDQAQKRDLMKIERFHDNNGGYGTDHHVPSEKPPLKTIMKGL